MSDEPHPPSRPPARLRDLPRAEGASLHPRPVEYGIWNRPDRPFVVTAIGWVCAGIGYLSFFVKGSQLPSYFMDMKWLNPNWQPMPLTRGEFMINVSFLLIEMLIALMAIAGGLGSLKLREWARRTLIYYALAGLAIGLLKTIYQIAKLDKMIDFQISTTTEYIDRNAFGNRQFFYLITTSLMGMVWSLLIVGLMTRQHVRRAFDQARGLVRDETGARGNGDATNPPQAHGDDDWRSN